MTTTEAGLDLSVYLGVEVGFPDVVPKDDDELARIEADQTSASNLVKQQWDVVASNGLVRDTLSAEDASIAYYDSVNTAPASSEPDEDWGCTDFSDSSSSNCSGSGTSMFGNYSPTAVMIVGGCVAALLIFAVLGYLYSSGADAPAADGSAKKNFDQL